MVLLGSSLDKIFGWLIDWHELGALAVISILLTLLTTLAYKYFTDQTLMKTLKTEMKEDQKRVKELKEDPDKAAQLTKQLMEKNMKYMMHSFKPMLFTFIPLIIIFGWLRERYVDYDFGYLGLESWLWPYILISIIASIIIRKVLKIH